MHGLYNLLEKQIHKFEEDSSKDDKLYARIKSWNPWWDFKKNHDVQYLEVERKRKERRKDSYTCNKNCGN